MQRKRGKQVGKVVSKRWSGVMGGSPLQMQRYAYEPGRLGPLRLNSPLDDVAGKIAGVHTHPVSWYGPDEDMIVLPYGMRAVDYEVSAAGIGLTMRTVLLRAGDGPEHPVWAQLNSGAKSEVDVSRAGLRRIYRRFWQQLFTPAPRLNDTLGFRFWVIGDGGLLHSPVYSAPWHDGELIEERVNLERGEGPHRGIHAHIMPRDWRATADRIIASHPPGIAAGIVERFGKSVVGTKGWRAEWVVIRELVVPEENRMKVEQAYLDIPIHSARKAKWLT